MVRTPFVPLVTRYSSTLDLAPGLDFYHQHRFREALRYFERLREKQRLSTIVFSAVMGYVTCAVGLLFVGSALKNTYDPLFQAMAYCRFQLGDDAGAVHLFAKMYDRTAVDLAVMGISLRAVGKEPQAQLAWERAADLDPRVGEWPWSFGGFERNGCGWPRC